MKRFFAVLGLSMVLLLSCFASFEAGAVEVKVAGQWDFAFGWVNNRVFRNSVHGSAGMRDNDNFEARQRIRTQIDFIASEQLRGVLMFEIGNIDWGKDQMESYGYYGQSRQVKYGRDSGGGLDADGVNIKTKRAYLDWMIPDTGIAVRMGIQGLKLPSGRMGNPVFDADVAGVVVSSPITDWLSASLFWARPFNAYLNDDDAFVGGADYHDEVDLFGLVLPVTGEGWSVTPWGMYGFIGANSGVFDYMFNGSYDNTVGQASSYSNPSNYFGGAQNSRTKGIWLGGNVSLDIFEPLAFNLDAMWGRMPRANLKGFGPEPGFGIIAQDTSYVGFWRGGSRFGFNGWYVGATLDYTLDWGIPGVFGWYASGDKANAYYDGMLGRLPVIGTDGGFKATSFGTKGYYGIGNGGDTALISNTGTGTWGIGVQIADVSFVQDLSHTLRFAYYEGTNDHKVVYDGGVYGTLSYASDSLYLTDKDSVFEINFDHKYNINDNLTAVLELGYIHLDMDKNVWEEQWQLSEKSRRATDEAWKAELNFRYSF